MAERGWSGYVLDVVTGGALSSYRLLEYINCIKNENSIALVQIIKSKKGVCGLPNPAQPGQIMEFLSSADR